MNGEQEEVLCGLDTSGACLWGSPDSELSNPSQGYSHPAQACNGHILGAQLPAVASALQLGRHQARKACKPLSVTHGWEQLGSQMPLIPEQMSLD